MSDQAEESYDSILRAVAASPHVEPGLFVGSGLLDGRLRVLRRLGEGGMGTVFEVNDSQRSDRVAVKMLKRSDASGVYRLKNEFRALSKINHPHVVRLYELFADGPDWFFTMELIDGVAFDRWVRPGEVLDEERLRLALQQLAGAVHAIHRAGQLHQDLKPGNVLVDRNRRVVVLDFGLTVGGDRGGIGQTLSVNPISGTPAFMAPEQALGRPATAASDLYALGGMLFQALTGRLPFEGAGLEVLAEKQRRPAPRCHELDPHVPSDLDALCASLLERDPCQRPALHELLERLGEAPPDVQLARAGRADAESAIPLLGREDELASLRAALASTLDGNAVVVTITGASGVGKTALCDEFLRRARDEHAAVVLAGRCFARETVPFKAVDPVVDSLARYLRSLPAAAAAALLPRDAGALAQLFPVLMRVDAFARAPRRVHADGPGLRTCACSALSELLVRLRDRAPLVVCIDDLQWADHESVALLRQLLVRQDAAPLLLLLTQRESDEATPSLASRVMEAASENTRWDVRTLSLRPLDDAAALALAVHVLAAQGHGEGAATTLAKEAGGNPFWLRELCAQTGSARESSATVSFAELLQLRLRALDERARRLLDTLALAGRPLALPLALAAAAAGSFELDFLQRERLVIASAAHDDLQRLECAHDRIREELLTALSPARRRELYGGLAGVLPVHGREEDSELLCEALEQIGDTNAAAAQAERAAQVAERALAFDRAALLLQRALVLRVSSGASMAALQERLGHVLAHAGRGAEAAAAYCSASWHAGEQALDLRRRAAEQLLATGHLTAGTALLSEVCAQACVSFPEGTTRSLSSLLWNTARHRLKGLDLIPSRTVSRDALLRLDVAHTAVTGLLGYRPLQAASAAARYLSAALDQGDDRHLVWSLGYNAIADRLASRRGGAWARSLCESMDAVAARSPQLELTAFANLTHGVVAFHGGAFTRARGCLSQAVEQLQATQCSSHERDIAELYEVNSACVCGDYDYLRHVVPERLELAHHRDRIWLAAVLTGPWAALAFLASDQPAVLRRHIALGRKRMVSLESASWPEFLLLISEVMCALYEGQPAAGLSLLQAREAAYGRALLTRSGSAAYSVMTRYRAEAALGALAQDVERGRPARASPWLQEATRGVRDAHRLRRSDWPGLVAVLDAGLASCLGETSRAATLLRAGLRECEDAGVAMHAAATRRSLGLLLGGVSGQQMRAVSEAFMRQQGVVDPVALTALLCPGQARG